MCDHFKTHLFVEQGWYPQLVDVQVNRLTDPYNFFCLPESLNFTGAWSNSSYHVLTINKNCSYSYISVNYKTFILHQQILKNEMFKETEWRVPLHNNANRKFGSTLSAGTENSRILFWMFNPSCTGTFSPSFISVLF